MEQGKRKPNQKYVRFLPAIIAVSVVALTSADSDPSNAESVIGKTPAHLLSFNNSQHLSDLSTITGKESRYIVTFKSISGNEISAESLLLKQLKGYSSEALQLLALDKNSVAVTLTRNQIRILNESDAEAFIEKDKAVSLSGLSSGTTSFGESAAQTISWGVTRIGTADGAATNRTAWIVDSGIQLDHPDLNVDAVASKSFLKTKPSPADEYGHGTQVAGILAAKNNDFGVAGVAAGARLVSLRVMDEKGNGSVSAVVAALKHVAEHGKPGDVVNLSLGASPSETLDNAALAVAAKGIFVVIAAGNISDDANKYSPARVNHPNVFTISAMKTDQTYMGVSNWGSPVDYCAPGSKLTSTHINSAYGKAAGTSMAAPHLSGILLLKGNNIKTQGTVLNDPDGNPDPIPML